MSYRLGVDLGTTYSSAAVAVDGKAKIVTLGSRAAAMPSVVLARHDGQLLVGEAADRRGMAEPERVAREFKRRFGDPTPYNLGGTAMRADQLMAALLPAVLEAAAKEGGPPDLLALTHPANWGQAKRTMLRTAAGSLGLDLPPIILVSEPEAAAIYYAETEHIAVGEVVAVYDLGGGTFDAALLRRTATGFELMGPPEGIDRLGGVDFDAAVFAHVNRFLDGALDTLDAADPTVAAGLSRLRADCVEAKEALSADTDVTLPVLLPGLRTEVRMTRAEFESMIRPALGDTIGALRRAMRQAHVVASDVKVVLLVGGSSRIPLVAQMVGAEVGRPVAIDVHPKHAVALGAALAADAAFRSGAGDAGRGGAPEPAAAPAPPEPGPPVAPATPAPAPPSPIPPSPTPTPAAAVPTAGSPAAQTPTAAGNPSIGPGDPGLAAPPSFAAPTEPPNATPVTGGPPPPAPGGGPERSPATLASTAQQPPSQQPSASPHGAPPPSSGATPFGSDPTPDDAGGGRRLALLAALAGLVAVVVAVALILRNNNSPSATASSTTVGASGPASSAAVASTAKSATTSAATVTTAATTSTTAAPTATTVPTATTLPADCEQKPQPFVCIFSVSKDAQGVLIIPFKTYGYTAAKSAKHVHFFFPAYPEIAADVRNAGTGGPNPQSHWVLWDEPNPFGKDGGVNGAYTVADAKAIGAKEICVLVADSVHAVTPGTGNCLPIPASVLG